MSTTVYSDLRRLKKKWGPVDFGGASNFSNLLAPWASDSRSLILRAVTSIVFVKNKVLSCVHNIIFNKHGRLMILLLDIFESFSADTSCNMCKRYQRETPPSVMAKEGLVVDGEKYDIVDSFRYMGDMLSTEGGGRFSNSKSKVSWKKFRELAPILTSKVPSIRMKGQVYMA